MSCPHNSDLQFGLDHAKRTRDSMPAAGDNGEASVNDENSNEFNCADQVHHIQNKNELAETNISNDSSQNNLVHTAMEKASSDRNFSRNSTRNMARDVGHSLVDDD